MMMRPLLVAMMLCWALLEATCLHAQPLAPAPTPPHAQLRQQPGAQLPLALQLTDSEGHTAPLAEFFGDRPVLLALGYYSCPQLCGLVMHGLLDALHDSGLSRADYRIVRVSIDPEDTPQTARARRDLDLSYAEFLLGNGATAQPLDLHLLTGDAQAVRELATAAGFDYERSNNDPDPAARFAHPAAVLVATPAGRISSYLTGISFDPFELRLALVDAGDGRIGTLSDRVALLCAHFDPRLGRHSEAVMTVLRMMGVLLVLLLAGLWWWQQRPARAARRARP